MIWLLALLLLWDFPQDFAPQPVSWLIDYTSSEGAVVEQMTVPSVFCSSRSAYCAQWPRCPDPGVYLFWVQAQWSEGQVSARSNIATCEFKAGKPCVCQQPKEEQPSSEVAHATAATPSPQPNLTMPPLPVFAPNYPPAPA